MKSGNPIFRGKILSRFDSITERSEGMMTVGGTVNKSALLLAIIIASASFTWATNSPNMWLIGGFAGSLIFAIITTFKPEWAHITAPIYALFEGFFLGGLTLMVNTLYPGLALQAAGLTFAILFTLLFAYKIGLIRATEGFVRGVIIATGGVLIFYLATFVLRLFLPVPYLHQMGWLGLIISLVIVVIAALSLILDFAFIESSISEQAPKQVEWYAAFSLMVTLVWLYVEIIRFLWILATIFGDD